MSSFPRLSVRVHQCERPHSNVITILSPLQAMAVRGSEEEVVSELNGVAAARCFPGSRFQELPETGMSDLAAACRGAGMEDLFLAALKIVKT